MHDDTVGIVLAGGRSTRLGDRAPGPAGKAAVIVGGETCLARVCRAVGAVVPRVVVVAAAGQPVPELPGTVEIVRDTNAAAGPLAGLRDGLRHVGAGPTPPRWAVVTSCDVPLLRADVVRRLVDLARSTARRFVVPIIDSHPQVLVSVMACDLSALVESMVLQGRGLRAVLVALVADEPDSVQLVTAAELADIDPGLDSFLDIDLPADLARLESRGIPASRP